MPTIANALALVSSRKRESVRRAITAPDAKLATSGNNIVVICPRQARVYKHLASKRAFRNERDVLTVVARISPPYRGLVGGGVVSYSGRWVWSEYLPLRSLNRQLGTTDDRVCPALPKRVAWDIFFQVACILLWMHRHHLLHLDVKPSNIFVRGVHSDGTYDVALGDYDHAHDVKRRADYKSPFGTPIYAAPEASKRQYGARAPAADVFALGATTYELLTGTDFDGARNLHGVIRDMTAHEASARPTLRALLIDPRVTKYIPKRRQREIFERLGESTLPKVA